MSDQIDIAVDLGAMPPPLPDILTLEQLVAVAEHDQLMPKRQILE